MRNIDFNHPIRAVAGGNDPATMAAAAIVLLQRHPATSTGQAHMAVAVAQRIQEGGASTALLPAEVQLLKQVVGANAAGLSSSALAQLSRHLGFVGCSR